VVVDFVTQPEGVVSAPHTYVVASQELHNYLSRRKLTTVSLDVLSRDMAALEAWQRIISEQAA
jgi:hypothetical protein